MHEAPEKMACSCPHVMSSVYAVCLQTQRGFSLQHRGGPAEGMLTEDTNLPAGAGNHAGAAEEAAAKEEGDDKTADGRVRQDAGRCGQ